MEIKNYNSAKIIREQIDAAWKNLNAIREIKSKEEDPDFNLCKQTAIDALRANIDMLEEKFKEI